MSLSIQIVNAPNREAVPERLIVVSTSQFSIGRDLASDLMLPDQSHQVSRTHAMIKLRSDGRATLEDLSVNGTTLNGVIPMSEEVFLSDGDIIGICEYQLLVSVVDTGVDRPEGDLRKASKALGPVDPALKPSQAIFSEALIEDKDELIIPSAGIELQPAYDNFENLEAEFPNPDAVMMDPFEDSDPLRDDALATIVKDTAYLRGDMHSAMQAEINVDPDHRRFMDGLKDPFDDPEGLIEKEQLLIPASLTTMPKDPFEGPSDSDTLGTNAEFRQFAQRCSELAFEAVIQEMTPEALARSLAPSDEFVDADSLSTINAQFKQKYANGEFLDLFRVTYLREIKRW